MYSNVVKVLIHCSHQASTSKEARGITETALRLFLAQLDLCDRGCSIEAWLWLLVLLLINEITKRCLFSKLGLLKFVPDFGVI